MTCGVKKHMALWIQVPVVNISHRHKTHIQIHTYTHTHTHMHSQFACVQVLDHCYLRRLHDERVHTKGAAQLSLYAHAHTCIHNLHACRRMTIATSEGLMMNESTLKELCHTTNGDLRLVLGQLQMLRLRARAVSYDQVKVGFCVCVCLCVCVIWGIVPLCVRTYCWTNSKCWANERRQLAKI
jgi:hypothetical protein